MDYHDDEPARFTFGMFAIMAVIVSVIWLASLVGRLVRLLKHRWRSVTPAAWMRRRGSECTAQ